MVRSKGASRFAALAPSVKQSPGQTHDKRGGNQRYDPNEPKEPSGVSVLRVDEEATASDRKHPYDATRQIAPAWDESSVATSLAENASNPYSPSSF